jgi:hypothetical protein
MLPSVACRAVRPALMFAASMTRIFTFLLLFLCLGGATARAQIFLPQTQPQAAPKPQPQVAPRVQPQLQPQAQPQPPSVPRTAPYDRDLQSYRTCTPAADFAIRRYLDEGAKIAREITARYAN